MGKNLCLCINFLTRGTKKRPHIVDKNNLFCLFLAKWNRSQRSDDVGTIAMSNYRRYIYSCLSHRELK